MYPSANNTLRSAYRVLRSTTPAFAYRPQPTASSPRHFHTTKPNMTVHSIETIEEYKEFIAAHPTVILDAFAVWCGPCKAIAPQLSKWSEDEALKEKITFAKFDVDKLPQLAQELGIRAMPTFTFFKNGEKVDEFLGANPPALKALVDKHSA